MEDEYSDSTSSTHSPATPSEEGSSPSILPPTRLHPSPLAVSHSSADSSSSSRDLRNSAPPPQIESEEEDQDTNQHDIADFIDDYHNHLNNNRDPHRHLTPLVQIAPQDTSAPFLRVLGLNAQKWPDSRSKGKFMDATQILHQHSNPDIAIILETQTPKGFNTRSRATMATR